MDKRNEMSKVLSICCPVPDAEIDDINTGQDWTKF